MRLHNKPGLEGSPVNFENFPHDASYFLGAATGADMRISAEAALQMVENALEDIYGDLGRVPQHIKQLLHKEATNGTLTLDKGGEIIQFARADVTTETGPVAIPINLSSPIGHAQPPLKKKRLEHKATPSAGGELSNLNPVNIQRMVEDQEISNSRLVKNINPTHSMKEGEGALRMHLEASYSKK